MSQVPVFFDNLLSLPMPLMIGFLVVYWLLFAAIVHRFLVPWIAGRHGQKLGRLEAEVPAQIGLAFGLLISFIAIPVWDQHNRAEDAARTEAAAYREMQQAVGDSAQESDGVSLAVQKSVRFIVKTEWPQMAHLSSPRIAAPPLRALRQAIHKVPEGSLRTELQDLFRQASEAREVRLRIAANRPPPARWVLVGVLAVLTLLGVGLIHADSYRARRIALGMVAVGIACCFVILLAYTRPYLGQFAIQPVDMLTLSEDMSLTEKSIALQPSGSAQKF